MVNQKIPEIDYAKDMLDMKLLLANEEGCNMLILDTTSLTNSEVESIIKSIAKTEIFIKYIVIIVEDSANPSEDSRKYKRQLTKARYHSCITDMTYFKENK